MSKVSGPLFSLNASGSIKESLTYSSRKEGNIVRFQKKQKVKIPPSWKSADNRTLYRLIFARWNSFSEQEKNVYNNLAKNRGLSMSGWNYFLRQAMKNPKEYAGLLAFWSFNKSDHNQAIDLSKNNHDGTLGPSFPENAPQTIQSKNDKLFNALSFNGIDQYVDMGNVLNIRTSDLTLCAWIYRTFQKSICGIVGKTLWGSQIGRYALYLSSSRLALLTQSINGNITAMSPSGSIPLNKWVFVVGTISRETGNRVFINAINRGSAGGDTRSEDWQTPQRFSIADYYDGEERFFQGIIDDVGVWNRVLSADEIKLLYDLTR